MSNLATRLLTAAVLIPMVMAAMFADPTPYSMFGLTLLATMIASDELLRIGLSQHSNGISKSLRAATVLGSGAIASTLYLSQSVGMLGLSIYVAILMVGVVVLARRQALDDAGRALAVSWGSLLYVPFLLGTVALYKRDFGDTGAAWLMVTLGIAFLSDTVAYFTGRAFGKHKLYPEVSPKKTWEGSMGGLVGGCLGTFGYGMLWLTPDLPWIHALVLGVLGSVIGQFGDLVESAIKRTFNVKDSGKILPGHGGMLDRVDALMFVAPVVYYYVRHFDLQ